MNRKKEIPFHVLIIYAISTNTLMDLILTHFFSFSEMLIVAPIVGLCFAGLWIVIMEIVNFIIENSEGRLGVE